MKIRSKLSAHILRINGLAISLCWGIVSAASSLAVPLPNSATSQSRTLSFADRVAYQYAIEEVYWRHRIWPRENPQPKPALDEVISPAQIEQKVRDYLRNSQALEDYWHQPLSPEQLQAEMERMATHTKHPEVLRELFEALGNDPFVIAECLARPALSEHLLKNFYAHDQRLHGDLKQPKELLDSLIASDQAPTAVAAIPGKYTLSITGADGCTDDTWTATAIADAPSALLGYTAVWTGSEMIIWGGRYGFNTGARYDPTTDTWTATSTINAPSFRQYHTAVWTGTEMIVWGGWDVSTEFNNGGGYNPTTDSWRATSITNAPAARLLHTAVWTGGRMIVWGGWSFYGGDKNTGGRYNPSTDSWAPTSMVDAPSPRENHTAVSTGSEMIVWGGLYYNSSLPRFNTGGRYDPTYDYWEATTTVNAPTGRELHSAVWNGSEMIVWGGEDASGGVDTGGKYSPTTNSWTPTSTINAPSPRENHTAVWTGNEMIVWGGNLHYNGYDHPLNTGGRYQLASDTWMGTSTTDAPAGRFDHTAIWTGSEIIVWGGEDGGNTGGRYCAQVLAPLAQSAFSRKTHGAAGTFDISLPVSGDVGVECRGGGPTNDYQMIINFANPVTVESASVSSGIGGVTSFSVTGSQVMVSLTGLTNGQIMTVTLVNVNDGSHAGDVPISMGVLVGDVDGNAVVDASDVSLVKSQVGQLISESNYRADVTASSSINAGDVAQVKVNVGTALP